MCTTSSASSIPPRRAFALGLWMPNAAVRAERFKALTVGAGAYRESHLRTLPLGRASYDLTMTLARVEVGADGTPAAPASRGFWSRVFAGTDLPDDAARQLRGIDEDPIDAAWLVETIGIARRARCAPSGSIRSPSASGCSARPTPRRAPDVLRRGPRHERGTAC